MSKQELEIIENQRKKLKESITELKKEYSDKILSLMAELNELDFRICQIIFDIGGNKDGHRAIN